MNKDNLTTFFGALAALVIAIKPVLDGSGYHLDAKTVMELVLAGSVALGSYFAADRKTK